MLKNGKKEKERKREEKKGTNCKKEEESYFFFLNGATRGLPKESSNSTIVFCPNTLNSRILRIICLVH